VSDYSPITPPPELVQQWINEEDGLSFTGIDSIELLTPGRDYIAANVSITGDGTGATATARVVNGKILSIDVAHKGINYSRALVTISDDGQVGSEATAKAVLEARNGTLRTYYYDNLGNKIIVSDNAGTIDYDTGEIVLNAIQPSAIVSTDYYDTNILTMNIVSGTEIIQPLRNRILTMDENNIQTVQLEIVAEK
jgi:hypothetical protein